MVRGITQKYISRCRFFVLVLITAFIPLSACDSQEPLAPDMTIRIRVVLTEISRYAGPRINDATVELRQNRNSENSETLGLFHSIGDGEYELERFFRHGCSGKSGSENSGLLWYIFADAPGYAPDEFGTGFVLRSPQARVREDHPICRGDLQVFYLELWRD